MPSQLCNTQICCFSLSVLVLFGEVEAREFCEDMGIDLDCFLNRSCCPSSYHRTSPSSKMNSLSSESAWYLCQPIPLAFNHSFRKLRSFILLLNSLNFCGHHLQLCKWKEAYTHQQLFNNTTLNLLGPPSGLVQYNEYTSRLPSQNHWAAPPRT